MYFIFDTMLLSKPLKIIITVGKDNETSLTYVWFVEVNLILYFCAMYISFFQQTFSLTRNNSWRTTCSSPTDPLGVSYCFITSRITSKPIKCVRMLRNQCQQTNERHTDVNTWSVQWHKTKLLISKDSHQTPTTSPGRSRSREDFIFP